MDLKKLFFKQSVFEKIKYRKDFEEEIRKLNNEQRKVLEDTNKKLAIIACPGSGKTHILALKAVTFIKNGESLLVSTFTRKAAEEILNRIDQFVQPEKLIVGTLHSFALKIIQQKQANIRIIDEQIRRKIFKELFDEDVSDVVSLFYNSPDILSNEELSVIKEKFIVPYVNYIKKRTEEENVTFYDLDQLIPAAIKILYEEPIHIDAVLIDEAQDLNYIQTKLLEVLDYNKIVLVGDPMQSIYEFRGASAKFLKSFIESGNYEIIQLNKNYRSSPQIIKLAESIYERGMESIKSENGKIELIYSETEEEEDKKIIEYIEEHQDEFNDSNRLAILTRTGAELLNIGYALSEKNIYYVTFDAYPFFQRKEIKDIIAYLDVIDNDKAFESFLRIVNVPKRGIGEKKKEKLKEILAERKSITDSLLEFAEYLYIEGQKETSGKVVDLLNLISDARKINSIPEIISLILSATSYAYDEPKRLKNIEFLKEIGRKYDKISEFLTAIEVDADYVKKNAPIVLSTIHSAKGLEFETVIIKNAIEGRIPLTDKEVDLEQEKNLFYVAVTRAKNNLIIHIPQKIIKRAIGGITDEEETKVSRFINIKLIKELQKQNTDEEAKVYFD